MKKVFFITFLLGMYAQLKAQQLPYFTQYVLNNFLLNPAVAGIDNYTDIKASHRIQWLGLQDAPVTTYLTVSAPTVRKLYDVDRETPTSVYPHGRNPMLGGDAYQPPDAHSGIGFTVMNDATGPLNHFSANVAYAYHLKITDETNLSLGLSAGITQLSIDASKLNFGGGGDSYDPAIGNVKDGILNKINPDLNAGLWLYSKNYFVGLSALQILPDKLYFSSSSSQNQLVTPGKLFPHLFAQAGYKMNLDEDITFLPSIMVRYINPLPTSFDINAKVEYQNMIWAGASYRYQNGFAAMLGFNINYCVNIGYSYDYSTSALNAVSSGSHEILVGFLIGNKYNDYYPHHAW